MHHTLLIFSFIFGSANLFGLPLHAQEIESTVSDIKKEDALAPPPPLPPAYQKQEAPVEPKKTTFTSEKEGDQKSLLLRDGTRVQGKVLRADSAFIVLETALGELSVPREAIQPTYLRLEFFDGDVIIGELLAENEASFLIDGVFGQMEIQRDQVVGFERAYFKEQLARIPGASTGDANTYVQSQKNDNGQRFSHSHIEPLIDIFFSPTGYTFGKGDIYISGLSLGYGFTDNFHATVNVLELVGLNGNGTPNLRATAKWNFLKKKNAKREWLMAAVLAGDVSTRLGNQTMLKRNVELSRNAANTDNNNNEEDTQWQITKDSTVETTTTRNNNFFGGDGNDQNVAEYYITDIEENIGDDDSTRWECYSDNDPYEAVNSVGTCVQSENNMVMGPRAQLVLANTYSWLLDRGGRFGWHNGVRLSVDSANYNNWVADPTYRVYSAFDLDLNHKFKLLGEVFYDPNYKALFTEVEDIGLDFGMLYAFTPDFRVLVHLEGPFLGLFWRF